MNYALVNAEKWYYCELKSLFNSDVELKIISGESLVGLPSLLEDKITIIAEIPSPDELAKYNDLKKQNKSLQAELDKEIKINHKLIKALKKISSVETCTEEYGLACAKDFNEIAHNVLKEIGEEE